MKNLIILLFAVVFNTCITDSVSLPVEKVVYDIIAKTRSGHIQRKVDCVMKYSAESKLDPLIMAKLGIAESSFIHSKINRFTGCLGIYQINPHWWSHLAWVACDRKYANYLNKHKGTNVTNVLMFIGVNTDSACIILREYLDAYDEDYERALLKFGGFAAKRFKNSKIKKKYLERILD